MKKTLLTTMLAALMGASFPTQTDAADRSIPHPLPNHPGNIFLFGEEVAVSVPPGEGNTWQAADYQGRIVAQGQVRDGRAALGRLPVGYYEVVRAAAPPTNRVFVGVLQTLRAPTPSTSPIGIDVAMAWFFPRDQMGAAANLCALAGMNRVRDRLSWPELEARRGEFSSSNRYDWSAQAQAGAGLQVLQVGHRSPAWANPNGSRFPLDLRDTYHFHRAMARGWRGEVVAFEPWNEADVATFGGHTGSEMASLQKAAYLGLKAGNPRVIACLNVLAEHRTAILQDLNANEAWPYFDTFNLHHYEGFSHYAKLYADFRSVSAGRPLWVTECSVPVRWQGDKRLQEPSAEDLQLQSERLTVTYAQALHEGAQAVFYFMLPHYVEGPTQFGILRPDLTPRPAFVALAAVGRLLADAKPLGRLPPASEAVHGYLFAAKPDGHRATVLVVWAEKEARLELSKPPMACFDHLGRAFEPSGTRLKLTPAPLFVVLTHGTQLPILPPPELPKTLPGKPCPLVLQAVMPEESTVLKQSAYKIPSNRASSIPIILYNFGPKTARGRLHTVVGLESSPSTMVGGWRTELPAEIAIGPGERQELSLRLTSADAAVASTATIRVLGDFGRADRPVLSFRIVPTVD